MNQHKEKYIQFQMVHANQNHAQINSKRANRDYKNVQILLILNILQLTTF